MGFFSDILGKTGARAAREAADAQARQYASGIKQIQAGTDEAQGYLAAYAPGLQSASEEYQSRLMGGGNFQPSVGFNPLMSHYMNMVNQGRISGGGYRSGKTELAGQEVFQRGLLEDYWRQMGALQGLHGQGLSLAGNQAGIAQRGAGAVASGMQGIGDIQASGIVGAANARTAGSNNLLNLAAGLGKAAIGAYAGGGSPDMAQRYGLGQSTWQTSMRPTINYLGGF